MPPAMGHPGSAPGNIELILCTFADLCWDARDMLLSLSKVFYLKF